MQKKIIYIYISHSEEPNNIRLVTKLSRLFMWPWTKIIKEYFVVFDNDSCVGQIYCLAEILLLNEQKSPAAILQPTEMRSAKTALINAHFRKAHYSVRRHALFVCSCS